MKKLRISFVFVLVFLLLLLVNAVATAQGEDPFGPTGPDEVSSVLIDPNPAFITEPVTITTAYDFYYNSATVPVGTHVALCIYISPVADMTGWRSAFSAGTVNSAASVTYNFNNSSDCPDVPTYDDFYYVVTTGTSALSGGDTVQFRMTVPNVSSGTDKYVGFLLFTGADCDDNDGNNSDIPSLTPGATDCSAFAGSRASGFTVANPSDVVYVSDTAGCGGGSPCFTGATGLQDAINYLPAAFGTIRVYNTATNTPANIVNKNILIEPAVTGTPLLRCSAGGYLLNITGTGSLRLEGVTVNGQNACGTGFAIDATSSTSFRAESGVQIQNFVTAGMAVTNTYAAMNNTTFSGNGIGVITYGGNTTIRGGTFAGNTGYAIRQNAGALTVFANNITGNNGGGYQAYLAAPGSANVAKNWWNSDSNSALGPRDSAGSHAASWDRRLGEDVASVNWGPSGGSVTLGQATLSPAISGGTGTPVIISFGRDLVNAPFGNGVASFADNLCSDFYDFYVVNGGGTWEVGLPVDASPAGCQTVTLAREAVYKIDPAKYNTNCATAADQGCWDLVAPTLVVSDSVNSLLVVTQTGAELAYTNFTTGDPNGADPTAIELSRLTVSPARTWLPWGLLALSLVLGGVGLYIARRKM